MSIISLGQDVAHQAVQDLLQATQNEVSMREAASKIPIIMQAQIVEMNDQILGIDHVTKPRKAFFKRQEDMPYEPREEKLLLGRIPTTNRDQLSQFTHVGYPLWRRSRQSSREQINKQQITLNLAGLKQDGVIRLVEREKDTAQSFRSVIELEQNIEKMRNTYLLQRRKEKDELLGCKSTSTPQKTKRMPKNFTFDYNGDLLRSKFIEKIGIIKSPLKCKSISACKILTKGKGNRTNESAILNEIVRTAVGSREKNRKVYSNASKRQISHFPFISLIEKATLAQNKKIILGPRSPKLESQSNYEKGFVHHTQLQRLLSKSINGEERLTFPRNYEKLPMNKLNESCGSIVKGPAVNKSVQELQRQDMAMTRVSLNRQSGHYTGRYLGIRNQKYA